MKFSRFIFSTFKILALTVLALVLLLTGTVIVVYSPWAQELGRKKAVELMNSKDGVNFRLDSFRLRFPLRLDVGGLCYIADGDTLMAADRLETEVRLLPLLHLQADINSIFAEGARYTMGNADSAMYMRIKADRISLNPASVDLSDMHIALSDGTLTGGCFELQINPDTLPAANTQSEPSSMAITASALRLDDFCFHMRMLPTIDSLGAHIATADISNAVIDLGKQAINIDSFKGKRLGAAYIAPDSATVANTPVAAASSDSTSSAPWTIKIGEIDFTESSGLYTTRGVRPQPGLDFAYIMADSMHLTVNDFYNCGPAITLPLTLSARERCGIDLRAKGTFEIADSMMAFKNFDIRTPLTRLSADGFLGMGDMTSDPRLPMGVKAEGEIANSDLRKMFPFLTAYIDGLPRNGLLGLDVEVDGTPSMLNIKRFYLRSNGVIQITADGTLSNIFQPAAFGLNLDLDGRIQQCRGLMNVLLPPDIVKQYNIPPMTLGGHVRMSADNYDARLYAATTGGSLAMDGYLRGKAEAYNVDLTLRKMPVNAFAPAFGIGRVSGHLAAKGHGFDFFSPATAADVKLSIDSAAYLKTVYHDINATASLADGNASLRLDSGSPGLKLNLAADGNLSGDTYVWTARLNGENINLQALELSDTESKISVNLNADASYTPASATTGVDLTLNSLEYISSDGDLKINNVTAHLNSTDSVTNASVQNRDFYAFFSSESSLDSLISRFGAVSDELALQTAERKINVAGLQKALPPFVLDINAGRDNLLTDILHESDMDFRRLTLEAANDSLLTIDSRVLDFRTGSTRLDTLKFRADQQADSLLFGAHIGNRPGTLDAWKQVQINGSVAENRLRLLLDQHNAQGKQGFHIGLGAELQPDSTLVARLTPLDPMIGYQQWNVNNDNFISYNLPTGHIDANLRMTGGNSSLAIYTEHSATMHDHGSVQEDLIVKVGDIHIQDWIAINPFAPQMSGDLNADMRLSLVNEQINAKGTVELADFYYDRQRVGSILADVDVSSRAGGVLYADTDISIDGVKTMTLSGNLNDMATGSPYNLNFSMIRFPLKAVNPFLPADVASLSGVLNGNMDIKGDADNPLINGTLDFDSTAVKLAMTGVEYKFSDTKIPMVDNVVHFDDFAISGVNENPLRINGTVDLKQLASPRIDLGLKASDMMLVNNSKAAKGADIYGKALINLDATVKGSMQWLNVNARLDIRPGTNVTYVMTDAESAIQSQSTGDMVTFVNFTDSAAMAMADSIQESSMNMALRANLIISSGSTINVDLSSNGSNKVSVQPQADLDFTMSPLTAPRITGRLNIDQGFVRYTPPLMSEKLFNFNDGSYIAFNGDMMNPTLNIHATDVLKANVTQEGQNSRLVNFDVILNVTGTFNNMNIGFDLTTRDDITVANELESMSAEQRANQAMNLLLYNVYTGPGTKGNASLSGNPLFSFLESQLNSWAANTIKGVDISFGIDQYDRTVDGASSQTTSYSYQVSKSLFNDRFKIVVGGNYSTDANADENFSQNLINDISFLYYLNNRRSMYVRIFRHTGYESIIEGEVTETGVGFVYRRKLDRVGDMFKFLRRKKRRPQTPADSPMPTKADATQNKDVKPEADSTVK